MKLKILFIISFLSLLNFSLSQIYTAQSIDLQLQQIHDELVAEEAKIEKQILDFISYINSTVKNLMTQNKTMTKEQQKSMSDLFATLNTFVALLTDLSTLDNYWPYSSLKSCSDANRKVTEIDFYIRQYWQLIGSVSSNITKLSQQYNWVAYYYTLAFSTLVTCYNGLQQQQQVAAIIPTTISLFTEYYNYIGQLARAINNETIIGVYLNLYKRQYCICGSNLNSNLSTLESNIQFIEKPLIELQTAILKVANEALINSQVASTALTGSSAPLLFINVDKTKIFLNNLVTMSDYSNIIWNSVTACSDLTIRIGFVTYKYYQYLQILTACNTNMTWTFAYQTNLNATAVVYKLTDVQLTTTRNLIGSMMKLGPLMKNYSSQLSYSVEKMWKILVDIKVYGDSYCGCRDINENSGSTTKSLLTTTFLTTSSSTVTSTSTALTTSTTSSTSVFTTLPTTTTTSPSTTSTTLSTTTFTTPSTSTSSTLPTTVTITKTIPSTTSTTLITTSSTTPSTSTSSTLSTILSTTSTQTTTPLSTSTLPTTLNTTSTITIPTTTTTITTQSTVPSTSTTSTTLSTTTPTTTTTSTRTSTTTPSTSTSTTTSTTTSTSSSTSTSTLTSINTTVKTLTPCNVTFVNYNPSRNPLMPRNQGMPSAGKYLDDSAIYPGYSYTIECSYQDIIPARLTTVKSEQGAGAYMTCGGDVFNGENATFIKANSNLKWIPSNIDNLNSIVGAVKVQGSYYSYYIGRINLTSSDGIVYQQVSKIHIDNGATGFWYTKDDGNEDFVNYGYEVLACNY